MQILECLCLLHSFLTSASGKLTAGHATWCTLLHTNPAAIQVWHVAFALWAFSLFGVYQSPLVSGPFSNLVRAACHASERGWLLVVGISGDRLAFRLMSADAAHLLVAVIVMVGVLFFKLTLTAWVKVRSCAAGTEPTIVCRHAAQGQANCGPSLPALENADADACELAKALEWWPAGLSVRLPSLRQLKLSQHTPNTLPSLRLAAGCSTWLG